mgnify:CR=1 FL=1
MKIKIFSLIMCVFLVIAFAVGCAKEDAPASQSVEPTSTSVEASVAKIEVTINVLSDLPDEPQTFPSDDPELQPIAEDFRSVLDKIGASVVAVFAKNENSTVVGSGVVIATTNDDEQKISYVVTCHHVIAEAESVTVKTFDGLVYQATFIGSDPDSDLCVMSVEAGLTAATVYSGAHTEIERGNGVIAVGNAFGSLGQSMTMGIVSGNYTSANVGEMKMDLIQTDAVINEGDSGGGLFTRSGYLIGIIDAKISEDVNSGVKGLNFAIPSDDMLGVASSLMETYTGDAPGYIKGKYNLGYTVENYYVGLWTSKSYVYIVSLDETGSLFKAGLKVNDRIDSVEYGETTFVVTDADEFNDYIKGLALTVGDELVFRVTRGETPYTITVTVLQYVFGQS